MIVQYECIDCPYCSRTDNAFVFGVRIGKRSCVSAKAVRMKNSAVKLI